MKRTLLPLVLALFAAGACSPDPAGARGLGQELPVPVEVARIERGSITSRRTFSGAIEATSEFVVAPKVAGQLVRLDVDLGDTVERGQVVAYLDDSEFAQAVLQAEAELAVARANEAEARSTIEIAQRALERVESLREEGVTSESELDAVRSDELASRARIKVTQANVVRVEAALEAARIRLGFTRVHADWNGGDDQRVVAERFVDDGGTVSANTPLVSIVEVDPVIAVVQVPEREYARLALGQRAVLTTDAYPERAFAGEIGRIAPVFRSSTRLARVELLVANADEALKPGMFVRVTLALEEVEDAAIVPYEALTERQTVPGVFVVDAAGERVAWCPVAVGVRDDDRVQVLPLEVGTQLSGRVVVLGQEFCDDGGRIAVVGGAAASESTPQGTP